MSDLNSFLESKSSLDWKICYKATKDGFATTQFHSCVNTKGEHFVVIESTNGNIFGGYVPKSLTSFGSYVYDPTTFLFSLKGNNGSIKITNDGPSVSNAYSFYDNSAYGPTFGGGHDLYICSGSDQSTSSYSNLGHSFTCPGQTYGSNGAKKLFSRKL